MTEIIIHGLKFIVEASGFSHAEADRDAGIEAIESFLAGTHKLIVEDAHAEWMTWAAGGFIGDPPALFSSIEAEGLNRATFGWHNPNAAGFMVAAKR